MANQLMRLLPIMGWKRVRCITHQEAAKLTHGNTDKFMNKDFWLLSIPPGGYTHESQVGVGARAVYLHDGVWWVVEKVKNF